MLSMECKRNKLILRPVRYLKYLNFSNFAPGEISVTVSFEETELG